MGIDRTFEKKVIPIPEIEPELLQVPFGFGIFWEVIVPEISKLRINQEAVWEQYSDIFSINKERHTSF